MLCVWGLPWGSAFCVLGLPRELCCVGGAALSSAVCVGVGMTASEALLFEGPASGALLCALGMSGSVALLCV